MRRFVSVFALLFACFGFASGVAQTPGTGGLILKPVAPTSGHGVSNLALLNQSGVRVPRLDVEPNGVRNVHTHDDVGFHLFIPITGPARLSVGSEQLELGEWQPQFIKGGTPHGFTNTGTSRVTAMEVFVKR